VETTTRPMSLGAVAIHPVIPMRAYPQAPTIDPTARYQEMEEASRRLWAQPRPAGWWRTPCVVGQRSALPLQSCKRSDRPKSAKSECRPHALPTPTRAILVLRMAD